MAGSYYCPVCGGALDHDEVDIGVGTMVGPSFCIDCGWSDSDGDETPFDSYEEPESDDDEAAVARKRRRGRRSRAQET